MLLFFFMRRKRLDINTHFIVFLLEEKETAEICTNVVVFLQEEKDLLFVLMLLYLLTRRKRL